MFPYWNTGCTVPLICQHWDVRWSTARTINSAAVSARPAITNRFDDGNLWTSPTKHSSGRNWGWPKSTYKFKSLPERRVGLRSKALEVSQCQPFPTWNMNWRPAVHWPFCKETRTQCSWRPENKPKKCQYCQELGHLSMDRYCMDVY